RPTCGEVVRRLGGGVDDRVKGSIGEQPQERVSIANVDIQVAEVPGVLLDAREVPGRVSIRPEEVAARVVVHADDVPAKGIEVQGAFRTDQSTTACHQ